MKDLINFFFSFDKLMKHKLVPLFFWAALIYLVIYFTRDFLNEIPILKYLAGLTGPLEFIAQVIMAFVGLRLVCELAIATFRMADNLSPDGGEADLADIDPLAETRRAAEEAAKRAREVTEKAVDATKSTASNIKDSAEKRFDRAADGSSKPKPKPSTNPVEQVFDRPIEVPEPTPAPKPKPVAKKAPAKKTTASKTKTSTAKKTTAKKSTTTKKPATKKTTSTAKKTTTKKSPTKKS